MSDWKIKQTYLRKSSNLIGQSEKLKIALWLNKNLKWTDSLKTEKSTTVELNALILNLVTVHDTFPH